MKLVTSLAFTIVMMTFQAQAATTVCKETHATTSTQKEVVIEEIANIRSQAAYGIDYDAVWKVKVQINEIKNGQRTQLQSFNAVATSADVVYNIDAKRKNGVELWRYFDEENQDGFTMKSADGKTVTYRLNCQDVH
ncbi:MAG: hypothetical protein JSU04_19535 [Bdellovibrionales bacterium]|nr:hypothetical protein [Bdellovibrionales bacterium]